MFDWHLFPHVDFNKVNLDWIADCLKALVGGTTNQILSKKSDNDFDFEWIDNTGGGSGGTTDYNQLANRPAINGHTLTGNQTAQQLGLATPSDIPAVPVQSVNGKTGAVVLDAADVGALPSSTVIPSKTSDLTNDSGFVNVSGAAAAAPVQSVNNKTGAVTLTAADVGAGTYSKPSGGIPKSDLSIAVQNSLDQTGARIVFDETVLATGTIPSGTSGNHSTPTNLTVGDLREWEVWAFLAVGTKANYIRPSVNGAPNVCGNDNGIRPYSINRWVDSDKTRLLTISHSGANGNLTTMASKFDNSSVSWGSNFTGPYTWDYADDAVIGVQNHSATEEDYQYKFVGIVKKE